MPFYQARRPMTQNPSGSTPGRTVDEARRAMIAELEAEGRGDGAAAKALRASLTDSTEPTQLVVASIGTLAALRSTARPSPRPEDFETEEEYEEARAYWRSTVGRSLAMAGRARTSSHPNGPPAGPLRTEPPPPTAPTPPTE